tara:strand:+ start:2022 stop:3605 length:1584 start_codon:yes stop_codon:yes gene_type:complete
MNTVDNSNAFNSKIDRSLIQENVQSVSSANDLFEESEVLERPRRLTFADDRKSQNFMVEDENEIVEEKELILPSEKISINFDGIPTKTALYTLASIINRNIILDPEITGEVEMELYNEPWGNVFNTILELNDLYVLELDNSETLKVFTSGTMDTVFKDDEINESADETEEEEIEQILYYDTAFYSIYYNTASDILSLLIGSSSSEESDSESDDSSDDTSESSSSSTGTSLLSNKELDSMLVLQADDTTQTIIASGPDEVLDKIETILDKIDIKLQQVYFEIFIVTATDNFEEEFGARLGLYGNTTTDGVNIQASGAIGTNSDGNSASSSSDIAFGSAAGSLFDGLISGTSGVGLMTTINNNVFKATLDLLEQDAVSTTISSPKLLVANGKKGAIRQQVDFNIVYYPIGEGDPIIEAGSVGLDFEIRPLIGVDDNIKVTYALSESSAAITSNMTSFPPTTVTEIDETEMFIKNNQIMVLGGIFSVSDSVTKQKVPGVGDLPVFKWLSSSKSVNDDQSELFIFIIPRII